MYCALLCFIFLQPQKVEAKLVQQLNQLRDHINKIIPELDTGISILPSFREAFDERIKKIDAEYTQNARKALLIQQCNEAIATLETQRRKWVKYKNQVTIEAQMCALIVAKKDVFDTMTVRQLVIGAFVLFSMCKV